MSKIEKFVMSKIEKIVIIFCVIGFASVPTFAKKIEINVLARVAGHVITDRQVAIDYYLENPTSFGTGDSAISQANREQGLERVIVQKMVFEESRIFATEKALPTEVDLQIQSLKTKMGVNWKMFLSEFDISSGELKEFMIQKILVQKSLAGRLKSMRSQSGLVGEQKLADNSIAKSELDSAKVISEWLKQLRARYRVQMFNDQGKL